MDQYQQILREVVDSGRVHMAEALALEDIREKYGITENQHEEALVALGYEQWHFDVLRTKTGELEQYSGILAEALVKCTISQDREILDAYREEHRISDDEHMECLRDIGWTLAGYETVMKGGTRSVVPHYKEMLNQALRSDMLSEAEDHLIKAYMKQKGISAMEHEQALRELGASEEMLTGKRLLLMRKELGALKKAEADIDSEMAILEEKMANMQEAGTTSTARLAEIRRRTGTLEDMAQEKEKDMFRIKEQMRAADIKLEMAKDNLEAKTESIKQIALSTEELEKNVEKKNKEVQQMGAQIAKLSAFVKEKEGKLKEVAGNASGVSKRIAGAKRGSVPSALMEDTAKRQAREKRMFRTAVVAVAAAVLTREEADRVNLDVDELYLAIMDEDVSPQEWKGWLTERLQKKKILMYKNDIREANIKPVKRYDNREALEEGAAILDRHKKKGTAPAVTSSTSRVMNQITLLKPKNGEEALAAAGEVAGDEEGHE